MQPPSLFEWASHFIPIVRWLPSYKVRQRGTFLAPQPPLTPPPHTTPRLPPPLPPGPFSGATTWWATWWLR